MAYFKCGKFALISFAQTEWIVDNGATTKTRLIAPFHIRKSAAHNADNDLPVPRSFRTKDLGLRTKNSAVST